MVTVFTALASCERLCCNAHDMLHSMRARLVSSLICPFIFPSLAHTQALKDQRARQPESRGIPTPTTNTPIPSTNTPTARPGRRATTYTWGPATGQDSRIQKLPNID